MCSSDLLSENFFRSPKSKLPPILKFVMTHQLVNFLVVPDFVAYKFADRKHLGLWLSRHLWGAQGVTWTITNQADCHKAKKEGYLVIFEGFKP